MKYLGIEIVAWYTRGTGYGLSIAVDERVATIMAVTYFVCSMVVLMVLAVTTKDKP